MKCLASLPLKERELAGYGYAMLPDKYVRFLIKLCQHSDHRAAQVEVACVAQ